MVISELGEFCSSQTEGSCLLPQKHKSDRPRVLSMPRRLTLLVSLLVLSGIAVQACPQRRFHSLLKSTLYGQGEPSRVRVKRKPQNVSSRTPWVRSDLSQAGCGFKSGFQGEDPSHSPGWFKKCVENIIVNRDGFRGSPWVISSSLPSYLLFSHPLLFLFCTFQILMFVISA